MVGCSAWYSTLTPGKMMISQGASDAAVRRDGVRLGERSGFVPWSAPAVAVLALANMLTGIRFTQLWLTGHERHDRNLLTFRGGGAVPVNRDMGLASAILDLDKPQIGVEAPLLFHAFIDLRLGNSGQQTGKGPLDRTEFVQPCLRAGPYRSNVPSRRLTRTNTAPASSAPLQNDRGKRSGSNHPAAQRADPVIRPHTDHADGPSVRCVGNQRAPARSSSAPVAISRRTSRSSIGPSAAYRCQAESGGWRRRSADP